MVPQPPSGSSIQGPSGWLVGHSYTSVAPCFNLQRRNGGSADWRRGSNDSDVSKYTGSPADMCSSKTSLRKSRTRVPAKTLSSGLVKSCADMGPYYQGLPSRARVDYERAALTVQRELQQHLHQQTQALRAELALHTRRSQEWRALGERCQLSACRLSQEVLLTILDVFNTFVTSPAFRELKSLPENTLARLFSLQDTGFVAEFQGITPAWARLICK